MNVLTTLPWRKPRPVRALRPTGDALAPREGDPGCGWYESSHDLARGLQVCEHADPAAVSGAALSVDDWLALQLSDWPALRRPG